MKADYFMTELNCSPQHLHQLIYNVRENYLANHGIIPHDLQQVFDIAKKITPIPRQPKHGKMCVHNACTFRMHCKTIRCPRCHHPQRIRKKHKPRVLTTTIQQQQQQQQQPPPPMQQAATPPAAPPAPAADKRPRERVIEYQQPAPKKFKYGEKNWFTDGEHECDLCSGTGWLQRHSCAEDKDVPFYE